MITQRQKIIDSLALFTSLGTLVCCALPALLVALGAGAALAGMVSAFPQLVFLSEHKAAVFTVAGVLIGLSAVVKWRSRNAPCPADPKAAKQCQRLRRAGSVILGFSVLIYLTGAFFAFVAPRLL